MPERNQKQHLGELLKKLLPEKTSGGISETISGGILVKKNKRIPVGTSVGNPEKLLEEL